MAGRISAATERALARVDGGETAYKAAQSEGVAFSTIYRALTRRKAVKSVPLRGPMPKPTRPPTT